MQSSLTWDLYHQTLKSKMNLQFLLPLASSSSRPTDKSLNILKTVFLCYAQLSILKPLILSLHHSIMISKYIWVRRVRFLVVKKGQVRKAMFSDCKQKYIYEVRLKVSGSKL